eukprot:scaffold9915_cov110-Cylindrotheca_fusiformis.AAC.6
MVEPNLVKRCDDSFTNASLDASTTGSTALSVFSSVASAVSSGSAATYLSALASCSGGLAFLSNTACTPSYKTIFILMLLSKSKKNYKC